MDACLESDRRKSEEAWKETELPVPEGFEEEYELAGVLLAEEGPVPRYDAEIDPRWRRPELSYAWEYQDYDHIGAEIVIRGGRVEGQSRLVGPRFMRAAPRSRGTLPKGNIRWVVMLPGGVNVRLDQWSDDETWTVPTDVWKNQDHSTSTITDPAWEIHWKSTKKRGKCRGYSADSHEGLCEKLNKRLPPKELLVGRVIWATLLSIVTSFDPPTFITVTHPPP